MIGKQVLAFGKSEKSEFIYIGSFGLSGVTRIWGPNISRSRRNRVWSHVCCWQMLSLHYRQVKCILTEAEISFIQGTSTSCPSTTAESATANNRIFYYNMPLLLSRSTTECWHNQQQNAYICSILLLVVSVVCYWSWQQNRHILIKYFVVGCSIFCCWSNGQLALVPCDLDLS